MKSTFKILVAIFFITIIISCKKELDGDITLNKSLYFVGDTVTGAYTGVNGLHPKWTLPNGSKTEGVSFSYVLPNTVDIGQQKVSLEVFNRFKTKKRNIEKIFDLAEKSWYEINGQKTYITTYDYVKLPNGLVQLTFGTYVELHGLQNPSNYIIVLNEQVIQQPGPLDLDVDTTNNDLLNATVRYYWRDLDAGHEIKFGYSLGTITYKISNSNLINLKGIQIRNQNSLYPLTFNFYIKKP